MDSNETFNSLLCVPSGDIHAKGFVAGSREELDQYVKAIKILRTNRPEFIDRHVIADWEQHAATMPENDIVTDYLDEVQATYYTPFLGELSSEPLCRQSSTAAGIVPVVSKQRSSSNIFMGVPIQETTNINSVHHYGNNKSVAPRNIIANAYETAFADSSALDRAANVQKLEATSTNNRH